MPITEKQKARNTLQYFITLDREIEAVKKINAHDGLVVVLIDTLRELKEERSEIISTEPGSIAWEDRIRELESVLRDIDLVVGHMGGLS